MTGDEPRIRKRTLLIVQAPSGVKLPGLRVWLADEYEVDGQIAGMGDKREAAAKYAVTEGLKFDAHLNEQGFYDPKFSASSMAEYAAATREEDDANDALDAAKARKKAAGYWKGDD